MIELTPAQQSIVDAQIATGIFRDSAEVVQAALELLDGRQREYSQLAEAIAQVECGEVAELDINDLKLRGRQRMSAE